MSIETKTRLYSIYLKPLIYYGLEVLVLRQNEIDLIKRLEGNTIKKMLGLNKKCVSSPLYGAMHLETTEESLQKQQIKFLLRVQNNVYLKRFIIESRKLNLNECLISKINQYARANNTSSVDEFNGLLQSRLRDLEKIKHDRYHFNVEVQETKKILSIKNSYLRKKKIYDFLYYSNYYRNKA